MRRTTGTSLGSDPFEIALSREKIRKLHERA